MRAIVKSPCLRNRNGWPEVGAADLRIVMASHFLRAYADRRSAWRASIFLMEEGLLARPQDVPVGTMPRIGGHEPRYEHWVVLAFREDLPHGAALLNEFDALPLPPDSESAGLSEAEPDLSRLPPGLSVPCASCRHDLRPTRKVIRRDDMPGVRGRQQPGGPHPGAARTGGTARLLSG